MVSLSTELCSNSFKSYNENELSDTTRDLASSCTKCIVLLIFFLSSTAQT